MNDNSRWAYDEDRTYHGTNRDDGEPDEWFRLVAELSEFGPTEREAPYQLRELVSEISDLGWGYNGTGTSATADAILRDALNLAPTDDLPVELREDFCEDIVAHFPEEFIIRRGAVLRWVRGWAAGRGVTDLPAVVTDPPPISRLGYQPRPESVRIAQDQRRARRR
jgi:Family of unknown function (DUF6166)